MKFSSALTMTTVLSILSATHGSPILSIKEAPSSAPAHGHYRRAFSVSELAGRQYAGGDLLEGLNYAHEPGNSIKTLLNYVKRQLGSTDSTTAASFATDTSAGTTNNPETTGQTQTATSGPTGLMGGSMGTPQEAGFAFEPGQSIRAP